MKSLYKPIGPKMVLAHLKEGNERFLDLLRINPARLQLVNESDDVCQPFATILSCSDMRIPPEIIFNLGTGDAFNVRLAGNIASRNAIGSIEYTCASLTSKLVVVLGHDNCCAVKAVCDDISFGSMNEMFEHLQLSILRETETPPYDRNSKNRRFVNNVAEFNVVNTMKYIFKSSSILREMIDNQEIDLVGAMYDGKTGKVNFLELNVQKILEAEFSLSNQHRALVYE